MKKSALSVLGTVAAVLAASIGLLITSAGALTINDPIGGGSFQLTGNPSTQAGISGDGWDRVCHQAVEPADTTDTTLCGTTSNTLGDAASGPATAVSWISQPESNRTIFTGGGSKDPNDLSSWLWKTTGGLPTKDTLLHGFAARYSQPNSTGCPSNGAPTCDVLYFGSDRADNSGDALQGTWFFQNKVTLNNTKSGGGFEFTGLHRAGDIFVASDFSIGGSVSTIIVYKWDPSCTTATGDTAGACGDSNLRILGSSTTANCATAAPGSPFCGIVNPSDGTVAPWPFTDDTQITATHPANTYLQGEFFEGGINLSSLGLSGECFASVEHESRSSISTSATLKEFILGAFGGCSSTIKTTPSVGSSGVSIGTGLVSSLTDSATLTVKGTSTWSGTVQFSLCGPFPSTDTTSNCATGGTAISTPVSVDNTTTQPFPSPATSVSSVGRYCWRADFTPSAASAANGVPPASDPDATSTSVSECFKVNPVTPALTTQAGTTPVTLGTAVTDTATLGSTATQPGSPIIGGLAGSPAGGTISFTLVKASDCTTVATGTGTLPQTKTVSGNGTYGPVSFTPDHIGTYYWIATYTPATGDPNNLGSTHNATCTDSNEQVVVNQVPTQITTTQSVFPNDSATITSTVASVPLVAGSTVKFSLYDTLANCQAGTSTGRLYGVETQTLVGGNSSETVHTHNTTVSVTTSGPFYWLVQYAPGAGDPAHTGIQSNCVENVSPAFTNDSGPGTAYP